MQGSELPSQGKRQTGKSAWITWWSIYWFGQWIHCTIFLKSQFGTRRYCSSIIQVLITVTSRDAVWAQFGWLGMYSNVNELLKSPWTRFSIKILSKSNCMISFMNTQLPRVIDNHFFCRMARKKKKMGTCIAVSTCLTFTLIPGQTINSLHILQSAEYPKGHSQTSSSCHTGSPLQEPTGKNNSVTYIHFLLY